jgi:putative thiamine transport system substrate-binding protein
MVRSYVLDRGSIANTHFLAILFDANAKASTMVVANFLMLPEAQAHKQDPALCGHPTVLDVTKLNPAGLQDLCRSLPGGCDRATGKARARTLPEPDPSWMTRLADEQRRRYAR